jgi:phage terminase small subunit
MMGRLTARQQKFCDEYLIDLNATQAAIRAGYSEKYANTNTTKLLQNTNVQEYLYKRQQDRMERTEITQDMVLRELALIAFSNAADYASVVEKQAKALVDGVEVQVFDEDGNPVMYRTVEPLLTAELTEDQKKALAVIKKGRDGFEIKPYDKLKALELLGRHLGMWDKKTDADIEEQRARIDKINAETSRIKGEEPGADMADDGFLEALRGETQSVWEE